MSLFSLPAGGVSPSTACVKFASKESNEERPARVSFEEVPSGRKNSSNFFIAPAVFAKSLACNTCVVECHEGPRICRATSRQAAVFPTPAGPAKIRWGGFAWIETFSKLVRIDSSIANSSKRRGAYDSSQDAINKIVSEWVFQPLGKSGSLCV